MTQATEIVNAMLAKLRGVAAFETPEQVCDADPQLDEYTILPIAHLREIRESNIERRGGGWKRSRVLQLDLYQPAEDGRAGRDALLDAVLEQVSPIGTGIPFPGTKLIKLTIGDITLEPEEIAASVLLTQIPITIEYIASN